MKKTFFSIAAATLMGVAFTACGNQTGNGNAADSVVVDEVADEEPTAGETIDVPVATKTEDRAFYTVELSDKWEAKQYASEMIVKSDNAELNFKEGAQSDVAKWIENIAPAAEAELPGVLVDGRNWLVYKNVQGFKTVYLAQVGEGVVRIGSSVEDPQDPDVLSVIFGVKAK